MAAAARAPVCPLFQPKTESFAPCDRPPLRMPVVPVRLFVELVLVAIPTSSWCCVRQPCRAAGFAWRQGGLLLQSAEKHPVSSNTCRLSLDRAQAGIAGAKDSYRPGSFSRPHSHARREEGYRG